MTAQDVIDYCIKAKENLEYYSTFIDVFAAKRLLDKHIAITRWNIQDFKGAYNDFKTLLETTSDSAEYEELDDLLINCEGAGLTCAADAYQKFVYNQLYDWAPFVLVGDWR
jgi:hypothetical protein